MLYCPVLRVIVKLLLPSVKLWKHQSLDWGSLLHFVMFQIMVRFGLILSLALIHSRFLRSIFLRILTTIHWTYWLDRYTSSVIRSSDFKDQCVPHLSRPNTTSPDSYALSRPQFPTSNTKWRVCLIQTPSSPVRWFNQVHWLLKPHLHARFAYFGGTGSSHEKPRYTFPTRHWVTLIL